MIPKAVVRILAGTTLLLLPACGGGGGEATKERAAERPNASAPQRATVRLDAAARARARLSVQAAIARPLRPRVQATGEITFDEKNLAVVFSRVDGSVEEVLAFLEDSVRAGQPLARLYCPGFIVAQTEYLQAARRADLLCARGASPDCATARDILASAAAKLRILGVPEAEVTALGRTRRVRPTHTLLAPIGGTVVESNVVRGNAVKAGDPLFKIANLSRVWLDVDLYEKDLAKLARGSEAEARVAAFPGAVFRGRLILVGGLVDEKKRTVRARAELANPEGKLRPGMFADVAILGDASGAGAQIVIPEGAVQTIAGSPAVFVEKGEGIYERREVRLGEPEEGLVPVIEGLGEGERVVVEGSFVLKAELLKGSLEEE